MKPFLQMIGPQHPQWCLVSPWRQNISFFIYIIWSNGRVSERHAVRYSDVILLFKRGRCWSFVRPVCWFPSVLMRTCWRLWRSHSTVRMNLDWCSSVVPCTRYYLSSRHCCSVNLQRRLPSGRSWSWAPRPLHPRTRRFELCGTFRTRSRSWARPASQFLSWRLVYVLGKRTRFVNMSV